MRTPNRIIQVMHSSDFTFVIPARSNEQESHDEACGPDLDAILRDTARSYMKAGNRSPSEMANTLGIAVREFNAWLAGGSGSLDLMSRFIAASGAHSVDALLGNHAGYAPQTSRVATMKDMLLRRFRSMVDLDGVRFSLDMRALVERVPETHHILACGLRNALDYAEAKGVDVCAERSSIERAFAATWEGDRAANAD